MTARFDLPMHDAQTEVFGTPDQQALQRRAADLWTLVRDDPRYVTHGRAIGTAAWVPDCLARQAALAQLQGVAPCERVPEADLATHRAALVARGLCLDDYLAWEAGPTGLDAARDVVKGHALPPELSAAWVDAGTERGVMTAIAEVTASVGVLLPLGQFMRGIARPAVCVYAHDRSGRPVACSSAVAAHHADSPFGRIAWWGMLATLPEWRGKGVARLLGAMSMLEMHRRHGFERFDTGIREGNAASERLCAQLGLAFSGTHHVIAIDAGAYGGTQMTR